MPVTEVQCYAGYRADERPVSFTLDDKTYVIQHIIDQWRSPEFESFKVLVEHGEVYLLKKDMRRHEWVCEKIRKK